MAALRTSIQFMSDSFEDQKKSYEALTNENNNLKKIVLLLESRLEIMEQREKANNIVIAGVPKQRETNMNAVSKKFFTSM